MPELFPVLALSTGHVTADVAKQLDTIAAGTRDHPATDWKSTILVSPWFEYGWWVYVNEEASFLGFPQCLTDCFALAKRHRAEFIKFDRDVAPIEDLPNFDW